MSFFVNVASFRIPRKSNRIKLEGRTTQPDMAELMQRMADLNVCGTTTPAGYLVFSVIDFIQHARIDTPTYEAATWTYRDLINRHNEAFRDEVVMIKLPRGNSTYRTEAMTLRGLQRLLMLLHNKVQPEFHRAFQGIITQFLSGNAN